MEKNTRRGFSFIGVSAVALVHDGQGRVLLQKRGLQARDERGRWDLCGGAIEFGDTIEDTIHRELQEELCVVPLEMQFLTAYDAHRRLAGSQSHWVAVVYAVKVDPLSVRIGEPHKIEAIGWYRAATLPTPLHSQFAKSFEPALRGGFIV
jgi:8-oxo-dGTP pyrophosphatase MutT (NUDIX family)